eukprot:6211379-Pleurochrysis_carterae.AAC.1
MGGVELGEWVAWSLGGVELGERSGARRMRQQIRRTEGGREREGEGGGRTAQEKGRGLEGETEDVREGER